MNESAMLTNRPPRPSRLLTKTHPWPFFVPTTLLVRIMMASGCQVKERMAIRIAYSAAGKRPACLGAEVVGRSQDS
jgi:hypothetical protein